MQSLITEMTVALSQRTETALYGGYVYDIILEN